MPTTRLASPALAAVLILAACSGGQAVDNPPGSTPPADTSQPTDQATTSPAGTPAGDKTPGTSLSACELVAPADIETALSLAAGTVGAGTLKQAGTVLDPAANQCRYDDPDWGGLVVDVTPADGAKTFNAVNKVYGDDAEQLTVGDGALWFEDQDRGYFLKGSVLVLLQFTYIAGGSPSGSFRDATVTLGQKAVDKI
jgi:hypothetical protein